MLDSIRQITIAEVMLLFVLLFVIPLTAALLVRLRRYEARFGRLAGREDRAAVPVSAPAAAPDAKPAGDEASGNAYPYRERQFLTAPEKACLAALREALGDQVEVYPKVALWELVEPTEANPDFAQRLHGKDFDYLVCDAQTGQPLTAVMFKPARGRPAGPVDEIRRICGAAGANVVFLDQADDYDAAGLRAALDLPDIDL